MTVPLEQAQKRLLDSHEGRISGDWDKYVGVKTPFPCTCNVCGHKWPGMLKLLTGKLKRGCPECYNRRRGESLRLPDKEAQRRLKTLKPRQIKMLSPQYLGRHSLHEWACLKKGCGKVWSQTWAVVVANGNGCPRCRGFDKDHQLFRCQQEAIRRGGDCLSKKYVNSKEELDFVCVRGHKFKRTWNGLSLGTWCPHCPSGMGEETSRGVIEGILGVKFPRCNPDFLLNPKTGHKLQLDGFNRELRLAFEYDGPQHNQAVSHWGSGSALEKMKYRDNLKETLCKKNGVHLIRIPHTVKFDGIEQHIIDRLPKRLIKQVIPKNKRKIKEVVVTQQKTTEVFIAEANEEHNNFYDYSKTVYRLSTEKVTIICPVHGEFYQIPSSHLQGSGCPTCGNERIGLSRRLPAVLMKEKVGEVCKENGLVNLTQQYSGGRRVRLTIGKEGEKHVYHPGYRGFTESPGKRVFPPANSKWCNTSPLTPELRRLLAKHTETK